MMTRKEYELIFQAFKSYRPFMTDAEEVLSESDHEISCQYSLSRDVR